MVKLSKEAKQRLQQLFKGGQFAIRWGFIPFVIYLGFKRGADPGMPEPTVLRYCLRNECFRADVCTRVRIVGKQSSRGVDMELQ